MNTEKLLQTVRLWGVTVPDEEYEEYIKLSQFRSYKKGDHIFRSGDIPRFNVFILKGCLRTYHIGVDGSEKTIHFAEEGYWTGDLESMRNAKPTLQNPQALEDCEIITLTKDKWEYAYKKFKWIADIHALGLQRRAAKLSEHIGRILTDTPETNYRRLMEERPSLLQRVPLYIIASYLGVSAETLSRIRKKISSEPIS